jgi:hypothetical protein
MNITLTLFLTLGALLISTVTSDTRHFITALNGYRLDSNAAGSVYILGGNNGQNQVWNWNDDHTIRNGATGLCLDSQGYSSSTVITAVCNGSKNQEWFGGPKMGQLYNAATIRCLQVYTETGTQIITNCCIAQDDSGFKSQSWSA